MPTGLTGDLTALYEWKTRGENCPTCSALRGRIYTYDIWMSAGVWPGFHLNCNCYLTKAAEGAVESDLDFFGTKIDLMLADTRRLRWPAIAMWNTNYQTFVSYTIQEIEAAHWKYGADVPIGEVLQRMYKDKEGFFSRSPFFDQFFSWRVLRTLKRFQDIDGTYSGEQWFSIFDLFKSHFARNPLGSKDISLNFPSLKTTTGSTFSRFSHFNSMLSPESLSAYTPEQSYHLGH